MLVVISFIVRIPQYMPNKRKPHLNCDEIEELMSVTIAL